MPKIELRPAPRKRVFVCSPLSGDPIGNTDLALDLCKAAIAVGCSPFAPHLYFTQFLDDEKPGDRAIGIQCGISWLRAADEMWIFSEDQDGCSIGMLEEVELTKTMMIPPKLVWMPAEWRPFIGRGVFNRPPPPKHPLE